jgi:regulator of protease activity HflC (stomatin/prohibitin superfamily)
MSGCDTEMVAGLMKQLNTEGFYTVPASMKESIDREFWAGCCDDAQAAKTIDKVWKDNHYLCDTHTAAGWYAAEKYRAETGDQTPIVVLSTAVENMDFSDAFTDAVEAKQVAEQNKLKAEIEQAQATLEAEAQAARSIIAAEAAAEVTKIEAEVAKFAGEKEAEMNKKLAETMTPELIEYYFTQRWDGKLPTYVGGDGGTLPILNMGGGN